MRQFFKYVFATIVGLMLFSFVAFLMLLAVGSVLSAASGDEVAVKENSVLKLNLNSPIREIGVENPFAGFGPLNSSGDVIGLIDLKQALANAKLDPNIKGVYVQTEYPQTGWASLEEIRNALIDFKKSKKFVVAYGEVMTEKGYYIASVADNIYLNPAGALEWNGLDAEYTFFKGTFDKLKIEPLIFRVGEFKSAVEPFIREDMSEANKKQTTSFLNSINNHFLVSVAQSRGLQVPELKKLADDLSIQTAGDALRAKLVTKVAYYDEVETDMRKSLKIDEKKKIDFITLGKYENAKKYTEEGNIKNRIAVIVTDGEIVSGKDDDNIASDRVAEQIRKARLDEKVKAIVIRVNSPGGSALASDVMWREVVLANKVKPVIASMSDYAASGGYYLAMGARQIVAEPNTITGSIGIFGMLFNTEGFFKDKLGITYDRVVTNTYSDFPSFTREMSPFEKNVLQQSVNRGYEIFTSKAAQGRKIPVDSLKALASGRVWSGVQAKANGLVDELGGLDTAIKLAAKAAKLQEGDYRVRYTPEKKNAFEQLFKSFTGDEEERLQANLGELAPYVKYLKSLKRMEGVQARMPFGLDIK
ncbi:signal peptide peptidase SppA [Larkinella knui]|uniref:Signal peptide peptidase SppA n=1 Tax=Larkinella knui TaxID=2025310 RepID=A0A3P1CEU7_9BACT|nr:signal peptide peptidase SppA [Larkinella knui]RRB11767.1 signal peptide peptidase SppA [Larkinella knui]